MELGIGNHKDLFTQSHNIISMRCIRPGSITVQVNLCSGNHKESLDSDKFHYDTRFQKKDVFRRQTVLYT